MYTVAATWRRREADTQIVICVTWRRVAQVPARWVALGRTTHALRTAATSDPTASHPGVSSPARRLLPMLPACTVANVLGRTLIAVAGRKFLRVRLVVPYAA